MYVAFLKRRDNGWRKNVECCRVLLSHSLSLSLSLPGLPKGSDVLSSYKQAKLAAGRPAGSTAAWAQRQCQTFCHEARFHWGQLNQPAGHNTDIHTRKHTHTLVHNDINSFVFSIFEMLDLLCFGSLRSGSSEWPSSVNMSPLSPSVHLMLDRHFSWNSAVFYFCFVLNDYKPSLFRHFLVQLIVFMKTLLTFVCFSNVVACYWCFYEKGKLRLFNAV